MKKAGVFLVALIMLVLLASVFPGMLADLHIEHNRTEIDSDSGSGVQSGSFNLLPSGKHQMFYDETNGYWYLLALWFEAAYDVRLRYWSTDEFNGSWTQQGFISGSVQSTAGSGEGRHTAYTFDSYYEPGRNRVHFAYYQEDFGVYYRYGTPSSTGTLSLSGQVLVNGQESPADSCGFCSVTVASDQHPWVWSSIPVIYDNRVARADNVDGTAWSDSPWHPHADAYWYPYLQPVGNNGQVYSFAQARGSAAQVHGTLWNTALSNTGTVHVTNSSCLRWSWTNPYGYPQFSVISWVHNPVATSSDMDLLYMIWKDVEVSPREGNLWIQNYTLSTNSWGSPVKFDDDDDYHSADFGLSSMIHLTGITPPSSGLGLWLNVEMSECSIGSGTDAYHMNWLEYYNGSWDATRNHVCHANSPELDVGIHYPLCSGSYMADVYALENGTFPYAWGFAQGGDSYPIYGLQLSTDVPLAVEISADLENVDNDGADWVFTSWKYYEFTVTVPGIVSNVTMNFTIPTSFENVNCEFFTDGSDWIYSSNMTYESRYGEPVLLNAGAWDNSTGDTVASFLIWFNEHCLDVWEPDDAIPVDIRCDGGGYIRASNGLFRIYSKGGFSLNTLSSNSTHAWILPGGTPFSFHVEDDGGYWPQSMYNEIWFRDVQHLKLLPEIHFITGADGFDIRYGVDYSFGNGTWYGGWFFDINPQTVHYNGLFTAAVWINMTVYWMNRGEAISWEDLYMYNHGSITGNGKPGYWEMWVDLWVSDKNASSVGAGRVNAYEYAMEDNADLWLRWLNNNWAPMDDIFKEWSGESPILAADGSTIRSSESVVMWRYWSRVKVYSEGGGQVIEVRNFEHFDDTRSQILPLTGISTPVFDETATPVVGNKGLMGALWTMISSIGSFLSENVLFGGLNLWGTFVNFLDSIAAMFGAPRFFTNLFNAIAQLIGYIVTSFGWLPDLLTAMFQLLTNLMGSFLTTMADLITALVNTLRGILDIMGGAYGVGVNVWEDLGISTWIMVAMVFYPIYLIILWDQEGEDAVIKQLTWMFGILSWVFGFLVSLVQFTIRLITSVIESIPVAE